MQAGYFEPRYTKSRAITLEEKMDLGNRPNAWIGTAGKI
jgi:hypothetical protein